MKPTRQIHDPYHNPFHNRFHVPVHARLDEMQALTQMAWLNEPARRKAEKNQHWRHWRGALAAAIALVLLVVFSATLLSR